jgi:alkylation response protein AidB-like acyl-CoA dehydrogenase
MAVYKAPLRDMRFVLHEFLGAESIQALPGCDDVTPDLVDAVLEEAGKISEEVLFPLNRSGDEEGCSFKDGAVTTPAGFKEAYATFVEGGWPSLACDPEHGGQGLPQTVAAMVAEMVSAANLSFGMYPGLTHGAYVAVERFGDDHLKETYLPKLAEGSWTGTMCLTEPQCGTDLGLVRTRAEPRDDGSHTVTGTKIFITAGDHDLAENIVHLVLARTPGAPAGTKGISLFLVPKFRPAADGSPEEANGVTCGSIEHKMGIAASSTCVINFDDATGHLVGEENKGMRAMFTMMNAARLFVGIQGLGLAETAYQNAVAYARERLQGRSLAGAKHPDKAADPIIVHPDVRRMLLIMRASIEGARGLAAWVAHSLDVSERHPDQALRQEADDLVALLTPVIKAYFTDTAFEATNLGMQVMGGHGYIRENGMEQYVRDARITQIYEGANGIQALDLVGRKLPAHTGRYLRRFFHPLAQFIETHGADPRLGDFVPPLAKAFGRLQRATAFVAEKGLGDAEEAAAAATDTLRLFALVALAFVWARMVVVALDRLDGDDGGFYHAKLATGRFFMQRILPQTGALLATVMAGKKPLMAFPEDAF